MMIISYPSIEPTCFDNDQARGVAGRVVIGKNNGADRFCMRIFDIAPGGYTPRHSHPWEHEIFVHQGIGEAYGNGQWHPLETGAALFIAPGEEHQIRNTGKTNLLFVCLIPSGVPEL